MQAEEFFNQKSILDLSFFNFRNAVTAAYFANRDLEIQRVNDNFRAFLPVLGNVVNASLINVLEELGISGRQIDEFQSTLRESGKVLIPQLEIQVEGSTRMFSLMSAHTHDDGFGYLNGVQGQFVDRTEEWQLRRESEDLLEQKIRDREIIEEKSRQLESLATRLAKYLSPQIYDSIFSQTGEEAHRCSRKNLTVFFSDIVQFTDLSDTLEPERLALVINSYLSEMASIAIECGGTIDKFIGDAILVFFGDPETEGEVEDALHCAEMAIRMRQHVEELQKYWKKNGVSRGLHVRMGVANEYCTVGNFGSDQRMDYTVLGSPVNLAARLQGIGAAGQIIIDDATHSLISDRVECSPVGETTPKGFARPIRYFEIGDFLSDVHRADRRKLSHTGNRIEVNVIDSSNIRAAIQELREVQREFENRYPESSASDA